MEYDVRFETNDLGFVDRLPYGSGGGGDGERMVFVGDSFTAGYHGGDPWLMRLQRRVSEHGRPQALSTCGSQCAAAGASARSHPRSAWMRGICAWG